MPEKHDSKSRVASSKARASRRGKSGGVMRVLELFAGAGGGILAAGILGHRIVCAVERDAFCREVLLQRQEDGSIPAFPIWDDIRTFDGCPWNGAVDVISGGFPCQPFSVAGNQRGADDERNLWPEMLRVIREVEPRWVFAENVPGIVGRYLETVLGDLAESGFDAVWGSLGASDVGAPHKRKRLWILANSNREFVRESKQREPGGRSSRVRDKGKTLFGDNGAGGGDTNSDRGRCEVEREPQHGAQQSAPRNEPHRLDASGRGNGSECWRDIAPPQPGICRMDDGMADRTHRHRLHAIGNGQVPQCYAEAWRQLMRRL